MTLVQHNDRLNRRACYCHNGAYPYGPLDSAAKSLTYPFYWAHDTEQVVYKTSSAAHAAGDAVAHCDKCDVTGALVLINSDGTRHTSGDRNDTPSGDTPEETAPPAIVALTKTPVTEIVSITKETPVTLENPQLAALQALQALMTPQVDKAEIERIVKAELQNIAFPTRTVVVHGLESVAVDGDSHRKLADVILDLSIGENVLMVGGAGTGKSTIARQAAEALVLEYGEISLNPGLSATALLGYMNATGSYVRTVFRERWEHGGVFHADEFDNGHPSTMATLNAALACARGGAIAFADGMVSRHDDFRFVASANTFGRGPDRMYVGRQQLDAATLDRFVVEEIEVDETLEHAVCISTGYDAPKVSEVLRYVRQLRSAASKQKLMVVISPRASIGMCRLLKAGKPLAAVIESRVRKGLSNSDWSKLTNDASLPSV